MPSDTTTTDQGGSLETAKNEARDLKDTAVSEASHVAETAKSEAVAVAHEAKYQAKDLYAQTQRELKDQAQAQQQRAAAGLRSVSQELDSMTANSENPGVATDLLRQASARLSSAASWLADRDPVSVLNDVKAFARRNPATFIIGAAILGIVTGRLTRALASNMSDERSASAAGSGSLDSAARAELSPPSVELYTTPPSMDNPRVYAQSSAGSGAQLNREDGGDVRSDAF
ncbi:hypothetical protein [Microbacterium deminutum]|uniref:DUF3618 domain-containing protein n=1 Tax=Microbacterium deminutum TaxID=344164 RepID=A0ABP5CE52_9MICO